MVSQMNYSPIYIEGEEVALNFNGTYEKDIVFEIQRFMDAIPTLRVGESFYFGMWLVKLTREKKGVKLQEYDFEKAEYIDTLDRSLTLWREQSTVCYSQNLPWFSPKLDDHVFFTPNALDLPMSSITEGIRDVTDVEHSSGWFIYTDADRNDELLFQHAPLDELLQQYNLNILRFLGLPVGWMFNIEMNGISHIWQEPPQNEPMH